MRGTFVLSMLLAGACTGEIDGVGDGEPGVAILAPEPGSSHLRDFLDDDGWLTADVPIVVDAAGGEIELVVGDRVLGAVDGSGELHGRVRELGPVTLTARVVRDGEVLAEDSVEIVVADPAIADCRGWLDLYQLGWEPGDSAQGVDDNVVVSVPINGVSYRYVSNEAPRASYTVMHCELARSLARAAPILRERGVVEVADIGVYNYRCIGGGTPPDCPNGISQHAYAKAIDIAGFTDGGGTFYSVNDDWIIDPDAEETCAAPTEPGADAFLHETICALKAAGVWNIVLTPNYNDAHRNHFHVDLTSGSDFIEKQTAH